MTSNASSVRPIRRPIWVKLAFSAALLSMGATAAVGVVLTEISRDTVTVMSRDYRLALAEDVAETVARSVAEGRVAVSTAAEILSDPSVESEVRVSWLLGYVTTSDALDHLAIFDAEGRSIDVVGQDGAGWTGPERLAPALLARLADGPATTDGVVVGEEGARLEVYAPIRPRAGQVTGYVASRIPLDALENRVASIRANRLSSQGELLVLDSSGRVLAPAGRGERVEHPLLEQREVVLAKNVAQSGEVSRARREVVASVLPLPELQWFVVVEVPLDEAYASLTQMRRGIWLGVGVVLVLAVLLSAWGARRLARPLGQLAELGRRLARRDFSPAEPLNTEDEVQVLGDVMNFAARELEASEEKIRAEAAIRADLGRYLPHELVEAVVRREQDLHLGGIRRPITVMFADIVRFTPLCETLPPENVVALLNEFFTIVTEIVFRHEGTVDKFVGDSVMAFWGAPRAVEDHADRALRAAEDILRWLEVGNEGWESTYGVRLEVAIGVNTGEPIVGNVGSDTRMEYTVIGDAVNTAARLEALARPGQILTTEATRTASREYEFAAVSEEVFHTGGDRRTVWEVLL